MLNTSRYSRSGSVVSSRSSKSRTPAPTSSRTSPVIKPAMIIRDLKLRSMKLPPSDFELPMSMIRTEQMKKHPPVKGSEAKSSRGVKVEIPRKAKIEKKDNEKSVSTTPRPATLQKEAIINSSNAKLRWIDRYKLNLDHISKEDKAEFLRTGVWPKPSTSTSPAAIAKSAVVKSPAPPAVTPKPFCIISLKPADSSLLPPKKDAVEVKTKKKLCLESLVMKINMKKDGDVWRVAGGSDKGSFSSSPSVTPPLPPLPTAASSSNESMTITSEGRKNKRKSSEPLKVYSEAELAAMELAEQQKGKRRGARKGGKKKKGRKPPPPKKRKIVVEVEEKEEEVESVSTTPRAPTLQKEAIINSGNVELKWIDRYKLTLDHISKEDKAEFLRTGVWPEPPSTPIVQDDEGLPPRIIVVGQEPGTVLEWYEEEIIVLRVGESPEQRPPIMKRKKQPVEKNTDTSPLKVKTSKPFTAVTDEKFVTAHNSLNSSQSSGYYHASDFSPVSSFPHQTSQSSSGPSPTTSTMNQVMNTITSSICVPVVKRDSIESTSSIDSNAGLPKKRAIRARSRYSPTPEDASTRCFNQIGVDANGVHMNQQISPI